MCEPTTTKAEPFTIAADLMDAVSKAQRRFNSVVQWAIAQSDRIQNERTEINRQAAGVVLELEEAYQELVDAQSAIAEKVDAVVDPNPVDLDALVEAMAGGPSLYARGTTDGIAARSAMAEMFESGPINNLDREIL